MAEAKQLRRSARVAGRSEDNPVKASEPKPKKAKTEPKEVKEKPKEKTIKEKTIKEKKTKEEPKEADEKAAKGGIPDVTLLDQDGKSVRFLDAVAANEWVVLFSYPRASTPGCTRQACGFRDNHEAFSAEGAAVFGISADSPKAQKSFETKYSLTYRLLSDPKFQLLGPLGAQKVQGKVTRSHWIIHNGELVLQENGVKPDSSFVDTLERVKKASK